MAAKEPVNWTVDLEVSLFHAMRKHKPVGVHRNFQILCIQERFNNATHKNISIPQLWERLKKMYNLEALNESEILPFPNKERPFELPENEYKDLMKKEYPRMIKDAVISSSDDKSLKTTFKLTGLTSASSGSETPETSPKAGRKRTRLTEAQQLQSPAVGQDTPGASKRRRKDR